MKIAKSLRVKCLNCAAAAVELLLNLEKEMWKAVMNSCDVSSDNDEL